MLRITPLFGMQITSTGGAVDDVADEWVVSMAMNRFPKRNRIKRGADFSDIIRHGAFAADEVLVVNVRRVGAVASGVANPPGGDSAAQDRGPRLGISIPRKTGPAVVRNRWKRWIREAFRTQRTGLPEGIDIIVRPKRDAVGSFAAIAKSLPSTVHRAVKKLSH